MSYFQGYYYGCTIASPALVCLLTSLTVTDREWLRDFSRNDEGSARDCDRRQRRWHRLAAVRIQMETGESKTGARLARATSAATRLADVVRRAGNRAAKSLVRPTPHLFAGGKAGEPAVVCA